ncbi:unnamed protein product [Linum tenue]|uniref:Uncharacterized protein n=1 Tax=Linum tenue TaxID=586396 RepID=A0AAV0S550_9ROSI|nr:unnamed protein product [Linum tenue]
MWNLLLKLSNLNKLLLMHRANGNEEELVEQCT